MCVVSGLAAVLASARVQVSPARVLSLAAWAGTVNRASSKAARPPAPTDGVARAVGLPRLSLLHTQNDKSNGRSGVGDDHSGADFGRAAYRLMLRTIKR